MATLGHGLAADRLERHGFDAFATDDNLARTRVSGTISHVPAPIEWEHIAFTWDETQGIRPYVDGAPVARQNATPVLDAGLDQFAHHQPPPGAECLQLSARRGFDEIRIQVTLP
jgi:hypothetical protein